MGGLKKKKRACTFIPPAEGI